MLGHGRGRVTDDGEGGESLTLLLDGSTTETSDEEGTLGGELREREKR